MKNILQLTLTKLRSTRLFPGHPQVERIFGDKIDTVNEKQSPAASGVELPITLRAMTIHDLEQVHQIDVQSFSMPWPLSSYRFELLENPSSMLWVAEAGGPENEQVVVGMVVVWMIMEEAHIATIAVHPNYRGRGIGRQLLAQSLQEAILKGASQATLEVRLGNQVAQNLYREFGFEVVGRRPRYYQDNYEDALIMTAYGLNPGRIKELARQGSSRRLG